MKEGRGGGGGGVCKRTPEFKCYSEHASFMYLCICMQCMLTITGHFAPAVVLWIGLTAEKTQIKIGSLYCCCCVGKDVSCACGYFRALSD